MSGQGDAWDDLLGPTPEVQEADPAFPAWGTPQECEISDEVMADVMDKLQRVHGIAVLPVQSVLLVANSEGLEEMTGWSVAIVYGNSDDPSKLDGGITMTASVAITVATRLMDAAFDAMELQARDQQEAASGAAGETGDGQ